MFISLQLLYRLGIGFVIDACVVVLHYMAIVLNADFGVLVPIMAVAAGCIFIIAGLLRMYVSVKISQEMRECGDKSRKRIVQTVKLK